ncbi:MAG: MBL fold metallo-hydrolase [Chloroflexota bacterium]|nr:MBL fold metallo-hydrolase [Chloroflexota bacterium]
MQLEPGQDSPPHRPGRSPCALPNRVWFAGHATTIVDLDGFRIITDPILRDRVSALTRRTAVPWSAVAHPVDGVVISHLHHDHLDIPSLRRLGPGVPLLVPPRAGPFLARYGFGNVTELRVGEAATVGSVRVVATPARHSGFRAPFGPAAGCVGFLLQGSARVYFAGDTDLFPTMRKLGPVDVALLPVWGWGPRLGPGHLDPLRAALALLMLRPKLAIPIHWGTLAPIGLRRDMKYMTDPPHRFRRLAREYAPEVDVRILAPGEHVDLGRVLAGEEGAS